MVTISDNYEVDILIKKYIDGREEKYLLDAIILFVENYRKQQGYYDFFAAMDGSPLKLHYSGRIERISFSSFDDVRKKIFFGIYAKADMDAPGVLSDGQAYIDERFAEIKNRFSKGSIVGNLKAALKRKLKEFGIESIPYSFEFHMNWEIGCISDDF